jgi:hypothetical protein
MYHDVATYRSVHDVETSTFVVYSLESSTRLYIQFPSLIVTAVIVYTHSWRHGHMSCVTHDRRMFVPRSLLASPLYLSLDSR